MSVAASRFCKSLDSWLSSSTLWRFSWLSVLSSSFMDCSSSLLVSSSSIVERSSSLVDCISSFEAFISSWTRLVLLHDALQTLLGPIQLILQTLNHLVGLGSLVSRLRRGCGG